MNRRNKKTVGNKEDPIDIEQIPGSSAEVSVSRHRMNDILGKSVAIDLGVLGGSLTDALPQLDRNILESLAGTTNLFLLQKVKSAEEVPYSRAHIMKLLKHNGLQEHRVLFYTVDSSKKAMMRQISPNFYVDNNQDVLSYLKSFVGNVICIDSNRAGAYKSFAAYFCS